MNKIPLVMPFLFTKIFPILVLTAIITAILQRKHLLIVLLAFEGIILGIITTYIYRLPSIRSFLCIVFLTIGACEARLGLACLVNISRSYGNDHLSSITIRKC